jgi:5'-methylthioadenosine phosphorylase
MKAAIIAGTGIYDIPGVQFEEQIVETTYGKALVYHCHGGEADGLIFLARHGIEHHTPPHRINYRANLKALSMLGVQVILATNAVGSISREIPPAGLALLTDFLDFTNGREFTYFDGGKSGLVHTGMENPYCPALRRSLLAKASEFGLNIRPTATYVATNGPRFETPAEIRMYAKLGGEVAGMTGVPEVVLARELNMHYAAIAYSINWASGLEEKMEFVSGSMGEIRAKMVNLMVRTLQSPIQLDCSCEDALMVMHPPEE